MSDLRVNEDNTQAAVEGIRRAIDRALEEIGIVAEGYAIDYEVAVDTGNLRERITHRVMNDEKAVYVGTNVEYAVYVELGHHSYPGVNDGKGFLRPAATEHADEYRAIFEKNLKG